MKMFNDVKGLVPVSQIPPLEAGKDLQSTYYIGQVIFNWASTEQLGSSNNQ